MYTVLLVDDEPVVLAGKVVKIAFLMELAGLKGREKLKGYDVESVICYDGK